MLASRPLLPLLSAVVLCPLISCGVSPGTASHNSGAVQDPPIPAKSTPAITWPQPASITHPTPLGPEQLDAAANVPGTFIYSPAAGTVLVAGTQTLSTTFAPNDTADYNTATASVKIVVNPPPVSKKSPAITWPQPLPIAHPTPLGIVQLDATANVPGTFAYSPGTGTVLATGTQTLSTTFTPADSSDYKTATASVTIQVVNPATGSLPHIYVQTLPNISGGIPNIPPATYGYAVAADGSLTPIPGFPLPYDFGGVVSGKYLYASDPDGVHLDTYLIHADGTFTKVRSIVDQPAVQCKCEFGPSMIDRSGSSLYVLLYDVGQNFYLQTFNIDPATGGLTFESVSNTISGPGWGFVNVTFSGNDSYLYGNYCDAYGPCFISNLKRSSDGSLLGSPLDNVATSPSSPPGSYYSEAVPQADAENHLAAILSSFDDNMNPLKAPNRLVSFTINPDGSLSTTNTTANMPVPAVQPVFDISLSPSGKLLAAGGKGGVQIFNFNGAAPITAQSSLLPFKSPAEWDDWLAWDNSNHLYALTYSQKLYVFDVTPNGAIEAAGSPYSIPNALNMFVVP